MGWSATIHVVAQDHFGLDVTDQNTTANIDFLHMVFFTMHKKILLQTFFHQF
ncbi:hypothetical protein ACLK2A_20890 [Escherichia coli]